MAVQTILVFCEKESLRAELLGKARQEADGLGWQVAAVALQGDPEIATLGASGADVVYPIPVAAAEIAETAEKNEEFTAEDAETAEKNREKRREKKEKNHQISLFGM